MVGIVFVGVGFHVNEVNHAADVFFEANREMNGDGVFAQAFVNRVKGFVEIATDLVDFVDKTDAGDAVFGSLAPNSLGLRLDAHLAVKDHHGTVENAKRALYLGGEVDVARSVDDVDFVPFPVSGNGGGGNGDTAFFFLLHPVGGSTAGVAFDEVDFVFETGAVKNCLTGRGFAGVDMRDDTDVAELR